MHAQYLINVAGSFEMALTKQKYLLTVYKKSMSMDGFSEDHD